MKYKPLALAAAAAMVGALSLGTAEAATVMTGSGAPEIATVQDSNIQTVNHRNWRWRHHNRYRSGVYLGLGLSPFFGNSYYGSPYYYDDYDDDYTVYAPRRSGSRHVRWCLNRYQSYDPSSNTFLGYDGDRHRCRSPYRY